MLHPSNSAISRFQETVQIVFTDNLPDHVGAAYYCEANYLQIDKGNVEQAATDFQGSYRTILLTTLIHEFIHVEHHRRYGCPSWEHPDFAPSTKDEEESLTIDKTFDEYIRQTGRYSPLDGRYRPVSDAIIGCPGEEIRE